MERKQKKYPLGAENYTLYEEVGSGVSAVVHRALCITLNVIVAVKIMDFERDNRDLDNVSREAQTMFLIDHPNVLKSHCSFVSGHSLWVIMPYMAGGSCLHILKAAYPDGFGEVIIATILLEVLKGLEYLHSHGHIHRDVKAGNILIGAHGEVKLADFGVSACLFDSGDRQQPRNSLAGTPCWMAPEVMEQLNGYDFRADIWSFAITALEFAHGHAPFSNYPTLKVFLMTLKNAPPGLDYERDRKFSKPFKDMIASCLVKDPLKRPSAKNLLKHSFFKQARSGDYIVRTLLDGLPALGDRQQKLKRKDELMLAEKKYGVKEEISQNEYKQGISAWNFDLEVMKAQASLSQDEDIVADRDQKRSIGSSPLSFTSQCSDSTELSDNNQPALPISAQSICAHAVDKFHIHTQSPSSCNSNVFPRAVSDMPSENSSRSSKESAVNSNELDEKAKGPVICQRGQFKVTSEEKVGSPLQKNQSIMQHPAVVSSPVMPTDAAPPSLSKLSLYPMFQSLLHINTCQREHILNLMKQLEILDNSEAVDGGVVPSTTSTTASKKSMLELAHDREKDLLYEIIDLQYRLIYAKEELQKHKTKHQPPTDF